MAVVAPDPSRPAERPDPATPDGGQRDRAAEQRDVAAVGRDGAAGRLDHDAGERDVVASRRDLSTLARDREGRRRDRAAAARDRLSAERDDAAEARDTAAELRDRPGATPTGRAAYGQRVLDRRAAAADRADARRDREAGAAGRRLAGADRASAGQDRAHSRGDRGASGRDRRAALGDRESVDQQRRSAVLDRTRARADRDDAAEDRRSSSLDELTGAYLRGPGLLQFERDLSRASRDGEPLVVAFLDVDALKAVNDQGGHAAGDRLLRRVAGTLQAQLRPHDLLVRIGGDEFLCVVTGLSRDDVALRLAQVDAALTVGPEPGSVTTGLAQLQPEDTADGLMERADQDLYRRRAARPPTRSRARDGRGTR